MSTQDKKNRYFPHDYDSYIDEKIADMLFYFRKNSEQFLDKSIVTYAAYGLYWKIIEHLHVSTISENKLYLLADEWRIQQDFLEKILKDFNLFILQDGSFISERVLKNLALQKEISENARTRANARWTKHKEDEKTKKAIQDADKELSKDRATENFLCTMCNDFTTLNSIERLKALNFYNSKLKNSTKENAVKKMLEYIKEGLKDE